MNRTHPNAIHTCTNPHTARHESLSQRLPQVSHALKHARIARAYIHYNGSFDIQVIRAPVYLKGNGDPTHPHIPRTLQRELRAFLWELLELRFPAWANAEGAHGSFEWDLTTNTLLHTHHLT